MPEEFEGDLTDAVFWGADLTGATFRDVNLTNASISHAWVRHVTIDAMVDHLVVNGVDVTAFVNEHDPWHPLRSMLRPETPADMRATWALLEAEWAITTDKALTLDADALDRSVDAQWSFVQTMRHLIFAMDKWFTVPVLGGSFDPMGMPNSGSVDFPWPGLDQSQVPPNEVVFARRSERWALFGDYLQTVSTADLTRTVEVLENGECPVHECLFTVFEEEFWHNRYARRDLESLERSR